MAGKIEYPKDYNPILEYWKEIESGGVTVSQKVYKTYKKLVWDVEHQDQYYFSPKRANHILEFIENYCRQSKAKFGGKLVRLELWEKAMLAAVFGFIDINGIRKYQEVMLIVGKKNGKSLIASTVGLYMMVADGEPGPECYAAATTREQAKIVWTEAKKMVQKSPTLAKRIKPRVADMISEFNDGIFRPLASDSNTLDGLNIHAGIMDEIHQWQNGRALYDIIADGTTAREQPLILLTSTAGTIREDLYDEKYEYAETVINGYFNESGYHDEHFLAFIYELDAKAEWQTEKCWYKANPGLGTIKNLDALRNKVKKAQSNPGMVKNLVCKEFNIRETSTQAWLDFQQLNNEETFDVKELKPRYGVGGADLSSTTDLTAAKVLFMLPGDPQIYVLSMYWMPEELVEDRVREDKIPYDFWIEQGYMRTCPGNKNHAKYVTEWYLEIQQELDIYIYKVGYDAWSAKYWVEEMQQNFGKESMVSVQQTMKILSDPMKKLGADLTSKLVNYNNNPIDKWCLANTSYIEDKNGNIKPCKTTKRTRRIDGTAALLDGYVVLQDNMEEYQSLI